MFKRLVLTFFILTLSLFLVMPAYAQETGTVTGLPLPRFVSLRSDTVYVRAGPGMRFPVKWIYQRRDYPLEIIQEFDTWRKIKDNEGEEGWVHQSLLSGNRHVLIGGQIPATLYKKPNTDSRIIAQAEAGVVAKLNECRDDWCNVSVSGYEGWIEKIVLWGVYEHEESK